MTMSDRRPYDRVLRCLSDDGDVIRGIRDVFTWPPLWMNPDHYPVESLSTVQADMLGVRFARPEGRQPDGSYYYRFGPFTDTQDTYDLDDVLTMWEAELDATTRATEWARAVKPATRR